MRRLILGFVLVVLGPGALSAQTDVQMVERSVKTSPNKDTQIGVYLNV